MIDADKAELITHRDGLPEDKNFILATWLRGLFYGSDFYREIPKNIFMANYHTILEKLLQRPGVVVRVACLKEDPSVILGYAVARRSQNLTVMDWLFVKSAWRNIGIGKSLVPPNLAAVTHLTKVGKAIKPTDCVFNPFL